MDFPQPCSKVISLCVHVINCIDAEEEIPMCLLTLCTQPLTLKKPDARLHIKESAPLVMMSVMCTERITSMVILKGGGEGNLWGQHK